jgi:hypothetical protein
MIFRIQALKDIGSLIKELSVGLRDIDFGNNFTSFEKTIVIPATSEYIVRNNLTKAPKYVIITGQIGNGLITKSSTNEWTDNQLYMYNHGAEEVTVDLLFIK